MVRRLLFATLVLAFIPSAVLADTVTYSYVSSPFTTFFGTSCPPTCKITGSFTVAQAFPANQTQDIGGSGDFTPLSFSFTEGTLTWTNLNTVDSGFNFDTDGSGKITLYSFYADTANGSDISAFYGSAGETTQIFASNDSGTGYSAEFEAREASGGTWTVVTNIPEPSSMLLLSFGLLSLACMVTFKKATA